MAEAFVKTFKRDYSGSTRGPMRRACCSHSITWFEHYNAVHPHKALGYRSPREFRKQIVAKTTAKAAGALRRPLDSNGSTEAIGSSSPAVRSAETRAVWLDASATVDHT